MNGEKGDTMHNTTGDADHLPAALHGLCGSCIDGWVPGEYGIERCDDCDRFETDEEAQRHVAHIIKTLEANGVLDVRGPGSETTSEV